MTASRLLLDAVVATTLVVMLAWIAGLTLRRASAALRHSVWRAALLAFWLVPVAAITADALHLQVFAVRVPTIQVTKRVPRADMLGRESVPPASLSVPRVLTNTAPEAGPRSTAAMPYLWPLALALCLWGVGSALGAVCLCRNLRAVRNLLRASSPVSDVSLSQRVTHWCPRVGVPKPPALAESGTVAVPTIVGWRRPLLLVPSNSSPEDAGCDAVVVHELAHVRRGDVAVQTLARVTRALWWWHPLAWLTVRDLHTSAEEACDDWAIALTDQRRVYAEHLVRWAEATGVAGTLAYAYRGKALIRRVQRILRKTQAAQLRPSPRALMMLVACAVIAIPAAAVIRAGPATALTAGTNPEREEMMAGQGEKHSGVVLENAVKTIEELIRKEGHGGRGHIVHYLFAMRAAGWDVDYETLMCLSGLAFSFYYQHDNFHVAYGLPNGWEDRITRATGFGWEWLPHKDVEDAWRIVKESIDSDRVVWGEYMEGVTFAGYQDADRKEDRKLFAIDPIFEWPGKWWPWAGFEQWWQKWAKPFPPAVGRHSGRVDKAPARDTALEVMRNIPVWSSDSGGVRRPPEARFGLAGIEAYAADIADTSKGDDYIIGPWRGCHAINPQWTARKCPGVYLRRIAGEFQGEARKHILAAAERYDASYAAWQEWAKHLSTDATDEDVLALHADAREKFRKEAWQSPEHRKAGSAAVRKALQHEKEAVAEIEKALAAAGV